LEGVPIYILNLNRRADRLSNLNKLLNGTWLGQQACRVPAVDAHKFGSMLDPSLVHEDIWSNVHQLHDKSVDEQGLASTASATKMMFKHRVALRCGWVMRSCGNIFYNTTPLSRSSWKTMSTGCTRSSMRRCVTLPKARSLSKAGSGSSSRALKGSTHSQLRNQKLSKERNSAWACM